MTVGLIDVDRASLPRLKFPNLALMKLSAWHKAQGDSVEWCFPLKHYDIVYQSRVFDDTYVRDIDWAPNADRIVKGGTGYSLDSRLPEEVEHTMPDYSLYGITDTAYGFLSRGCPRGCPFCIVAGKEGRASRKVADLREWWDGQKHIKLLDPNLVACPDWADLMGQLADSGAWVDITQGIDIRVMTDAKFDALQRLKLKAVHFAWDNPKDDLADRFKAAAEHFPRLSKGYNLGAYVLTNYNSTMKENLHRIYTLRDCGVRPYVMVYDKPNAPKEIRHLQRWVNNLFIFKKCKRFEDYVA